MQALIDQVIRNEVKVLSVNKTNRNCVMCGSPFNYDKFWDGGNNYRPDNNLCRNDQFWYEKFEMRNDQSVARINGEHYIIGEDGISEGSKGFGGTIHTIKFDDGREFITNNLWHQGHIPITWQSYLPNNAEFID